MSYKLYGAKGFGSVCVEAALELLDMEYELIQADPLGDDENRSRVKSVNPAGQVPALILPDGSVMTESAAILIYLGDLRPEAELAPSADAPERPQYLRWMVFLAASLYSTFTISDGPERFHPDASTHETLLMSANDRRKQMWRLMDEAFEGRSSTFLLGERMSLLDVYVAMMSFWSPRRQWFDENYPALARAVHAAEKHPVIQSVWARNYEPGVSS